MFRPVTETACGLGLLGALAMLLATGCSSYVQPESDGPGGGGGDGGVDGGAGDGGVDGGADGGAGDGGVDGGGSAGDDGGGSGGMPVDCVIENTFLWKYTAPLPDEGDDQISYFDFGYGADGERVFLFQRRVSFDPPDYGSCDNGVYNETLRSGELSAELPPACPADESSLTFPTDEDTLYVIFENDTFALSCTSNRLSYIGYVWNFNCANEPRSGDFQPRDACDLPVCDCGAVWGDFHTCDPPSGCD